MRLLAVEDGERLAAGLRNGFVAEGFAVDIAHDGTDGLWMARDRPCDTLVLDVILPRMNGFKIAGAA